MDLDCYQHNTWGKWGRKVSCLECDTSHQRPRASASSGWPKGQEAIPLSAQAFNNYGFMKSQHISCSLWWENEKCSLPYPPSMFSQMVLLFAHPAHSQHTLQVLRVLFQSKWCSWPKRRKRTSVWPASNSTLDKEEPSEKGKIVPLWLILWEACRTSTFLYRKVGREEVGKWKAASWEPPENLRSSQASGDTESGGWGITDFLGSKSRYCAVYSTKKSLRATRLKGRKDQLCQDEGWFTNVGL